MKRVAAILIILAVWGATGGLLSAAHEWQHRHSESDRDSCQICHVLHAPMSCAQAAATTLVVQRLPGLVRLPPASVCIASVLLSHSCRGPPVG